MLDRGFYQKTPFTEPAERNWKTYLILGENQPTTAKKTDLFDRFFRVTLGGPDGVWTRDLRMKYIGLDLRQLSSRSQNIAAVLKSK